PTIPIPSVGLHGLGQIANVEASIRRVDNGESVTLEVVHYQGRSGSGPIDNHISPIPAPDLPRLRIPYEVTIQASVGGQEEVFEWSYSLGWPVLGTGLLQCTADGQRTAENPLRLVESAAPYAWDAKLCGQDHVYVVESGDVVGVTLAWDTASTQVGMRLTDGEGAVLHQTSEYDGWDWVEIAGPAMLRVRELEGLEASYFLAVETRE
ncbi:MAG: hypothetical protein KC561_21120, partial [Myxococcales bacterium]|nr:hypothetical protein [Myxococcales bacterium]